MLAQQLYKKVIELNPKHGYALYNLATIEEDKNQNHKIAGYLFKKALEILPNDISLFFYYYNYFILFYFFNFFSFFYPLVCGDYANHLRVVFILYIYLYIV